MKHILFASMLLALLVAGCSSSYPYRSTGSRTQYINLYHPDGTRKSYGTVKGGYINLYNPNGTRNSYGTVGR